MTWDHQHQVYSFIKSYNWTKFEQKSCRMSTSTHQQQSEGPEDREEMSPEEALKWVQSHFERHSLNASDEWMRACVDWFLSNESETINRVRLVEGVRKQWLDCDIRKAGPFLLSGAICYTRNKPWCCPGLAIPSSGGKETLFFRSMSFAKTYTRYKPLCNLALNWSAYQKLVNGSKQDEVKILPRE